MSVPRLPGGLAGAELAGGVDDDPDPGRVDAELLDRDLEGDGVHALAHLGPAVAHLDGAVVLEAHDGPGDLLEAVAEAGVLEAEAEPDGLARGARPRRSAGLTASRQLAGAEAAVVHDLAGAPHGAGRR